MQLSYDINKLIHAHSQKKILVVGDVMLDRYWFGNVTRISPEAPVPIAQITNSQDRPGGAANVANNIASLSSSVSLLSIVGNDDTAKHLTKLLEDLAITTLFTIDESIKTTLKLRILSKNQQLMRVDFEHLPTAIALDELFDKYTRVLDQFDIIVFSDYGKGTLTQATQMIELAKQRNKTVLVDPKGSDYSRYSGASIITPNKLELQMALGRPWQDETQLEEMVIKLKQTLAIDNLLLTRSEEGMSLYATQENHHYPTKAKEVYDVSGAGDTVIATLAVMLKSGISLHDAVWLANIAAGIVVGKIGTASITIEELTNAINQTNTDDQPL